MQCRECEEDFEPSTRGSAQSYCSVKCRMRSYRRRSAKERQATLKKLKTIRQRTARSKKAVKDWESEAKRLKLEVRKLSRQLADLQRPTPSMAIMIDRVKERQKPIRYVAREVNGTEWAQGPTPKEALGTLVHNVAITQTVTVESVGFSY